MQHVLSSEGLSDWTVIYAADGYCWHHNKTIQLRAPVKHGCFLHEVAHALMPESESVCYVCNTGHHFHGGMWADVFDRLVNTYTTYGT